MNNTLLDAAQERSTPVGLLFRQGTPRQALQPEINITQLDLSFPKMEVTSQALFANISTLS